MRCKNKENTGTYKAFQADRLKRIENPPEIKHFHLLVRPLKSYNQVFHTYVVI